MCRRRRQQYPLQTQYLTTSVRHRRGCCSSNSRRQQYLNAEAYHSNTYYPQPHIPLPSSAPHYAQTKSVDHPQRRGMAALLIMALGLGGQKIKEKRDERKQKKAVLAWEEEQS